MRAKICGITNLKDALLAIKYNAWALGFNFYSQSSRYISPESAKQIITKLPKNIIKIGIYINTPTADILTNMNTICLDYAQIYKPDINNLAHNHKFILSLNINIESELTLLNKKLLKSYYALLLDAPVSTDLLLGGTGRLANWNLAKKLALEYKLILAGGLTPNNIQQAIDYVQPYATDVASGIEFTPGLKDPKLLKQFLTGTYDES